MTDLAKFVKLLVWDDIQAETEIGTYDFGFIGGAWTLRFRGDEIEHGIAQNYRVARADAKAAAQADYTARILSALDVEALEAALTNHKEDRDYEC